MNRLRRTLAPISDVAGETIGDVRERAERHAAPQGRST